MTVFELVGGAADGQTVRRRKPYPPYVDRGGERYYVCWECLTGRITYRTTAALKALIAARGGIKRIERDIDDPGWDS